MSIATTKLLSANAAIGNHAEALQDIHLERKSIAIYQRDTATLEEQLRPLVTDSIECRASGTVEDITASLATYFNKEYPQYRFWLEDILMILDTFKEVTKVRTFRVLLATVKSNMCRKFHTDINTLRLLCTYVGPGTLWLPDEAANHNACFGRGNNQDIVKDESMIQQVGTGDIVILKGALYPEGRPILHRSPTIEGTGENRLLLRIDTNENLNLFA